MAKAYIGIGSNLGDRIGYCLKAVEMMKGISDFQFIGCSDWYLTRPVGVIKQDWFVNGAASLSTHISAQDLLNRLLEIEKSLGRVRSEHWGPRVIDLDLLLYGDAVIQEGTLKVPHPFMHLRRFVLVPMAQLAPNEVHPLLGSTMSELLDGLPENGQEVVPLGEAFKTATQERTEGDRDGVGAGAEIPFSREA